MTHGAAAVIVISVAYKKKALCTHIYVFLKVIHDPDLLSYDHHQHNADYMQAISSIYAG